MDIRQMTVFGVTLERCIYIIVLLILITVTYMVTHTKRNNMLTVSAPNTSSADVKRRKYRMKYSDEEVYTAIKSIRYQNCLRTYADRGQMCSQLRSCDYLSEKEMVNGCKENQTCRFNSDEHKALRGFDRRCKKILPTALIIGTYKSGTRELIDFLAMNPFVMIKRLPQYEVSYFDMYANKGLDWYKDMMPFSFQGQVTIEKSPSYFMSLQAPMRIYGMNKDIKLIVIVRNPIERTLSHLTFEQFVIREQYGDNFNNCIYKQLPNRRIINKNCFAIKASFYDRPMERYLKYFDLEQIHVVDAAEFVTDPCTTVHRIENFLGVDNVVNCTSFVFNTEKGVSCIRDYKPTNVEAACYGRNRGRAHSSPQFDYLRGQLQTLFRSSNERFFTLVRKRFNWN